MNEPMLPMGLKVIDAKGLFDGRDEHEHTYISFVNGSYWLKSRTLKMGGFDWHTHFRVSQQEAREIVSLGYADWWINVDRTAR